MLPGDSSVLRKARGAFYTPLDVARFIADWAIRDAEDAILEPSCGEAVFLHAAGDSGRHRGPLVGVELHPSSAEHARRELARSAIPAEIRVGDFFLEEPTGQFDAVVGNPPYVRYQGFSGESRRRSRLAAMRAGVSLSGLASSWAAFTIHSALHLKAGGRLGLVLPAELLTVNYASGVRQFLMDHFASVGLVMFVERVFPNVQEEVILLLADGFSPEGGSGTDHCEVFQVQDAHGLRDLSPGRRWSPPEKSAKWSASMLPSAALEIYTGVTSADGFRVLQTWGETTLGMVTGNNKYFALSSERVHQLDLLPRDVISLSPPGSRHLRSVHLTAASLRQLERDGAATWLFRPDDPSDAAWRYIRMGESTGVDTAYKCRVRRPWWRVPYLRPADILLTYMNADTPRLATNRANVHHLNSVHGIYLHEEHRDLGRRLLALASINSVTMLGAETVGRAYGGGMLKIEPREADGLPVPSPALVSRAAGELNKASRRVLELSRTGNLLDAASLIDRILLTDALGMPPSELASIRDARSELVARRLARSKEARRGATSLA